MVFSNCIFSGVKTGLLLLSPLLVLSCRNQDDDIQQIDQVIQLFYKDASGKDLLASKKPYAYKTVVLKDLGGERDQIKLSGTFLKKGADSLSYIEYIAGAKRNLVSESSGGREYRSDIRLELTKDSANVDVDTLTVFYTWTLQLFQVKKMYYNRALIFTKTTGERNTATIIKR